MSMIIDSSRFASATWTPASLPNVAAWWDASDAASFTYSSGTVVSAWASRVGSYTLTQGTTSKQASRSGTVNGLSSVVFDGGDSFSVAAFDLSGTEKVSMWAVCSVTGTGNHVFMEHSANSETGTGGFLLYRTNYFSRAGLFRWKSGYSGLQSAGSIATTPKAFVAIYDGALSTGEVSVRLNGDSSSLLLGGNTNIASNFTSDTLFVGSRSGASLFLTGQICEMGVTTDVMTSPDRTALETYLSAKWALGF